MASDERVAATEEEPFLTPGSTHPPLAFGVGGVVMLLCWLLLAPDPSWPAWVLLLPSVPPVALMWIRSTRGSRRQFPDPEEPSKASGSLATGLLITAGALGFYFWAKALGITLMVYYGTVFYFVGLGLLVRALQNERCRWMVGPALAMAGMGLLAPYEGFTGLLWGWFYVAFGFSGALGMRLQMRLASAV